MRNEHSLAEQSRREAFSNVWFCTLYTEYSLEWHTRIRSTTRIGLHGRGYSIREAITRQKFFAFVCCYCSINCFLVIYLANVVYFCFRARSAFVSELLETFSLGLQQQRLSHLTGQCIMHLDIVGLYLRQYLIRVRVPYSRGNPNWTM